MSPGRHVIRVGEDVETGRCVLPAARRLRPKDRKRETPAGLAAFEEALGALEGGSCLAFGSGLAAVATVLDRFGGQS